MNHHEAVKTISELQLTSNVRRVVAPLAEEMIVAFVELSDEITVTYRTRFGNEQKGHMRQVALHYQPNLGWTVLENTVTPMKSKLTSRTGSAVAGLPGLGANDAKIVTDFNDPHLTAPSAVPGAKKGK